MRVASKEIQKTQINNTKALLDNALPEMNSNPVAS